MIKKQKRKENSELINFASDPKVEIEHLEPLDIIMLIIKLIL